MAQGSIGSYHVDVEEEDLKAMRNNLVRLQCSRCLKRIAGFLAQAG
jgi:hypothetical protein